MDLHHKKGRGYFLTDDIVMLRVTHHALNRFHQRVTPGRDFHGAADVLSALLRAVGTWGPAPAWAPDVTAEQRCILLGDDVLLVVTDGVVVTCLTRGGASPKQRRNARYERLRRRTEGKRKTYEPWEHPLQRKKKRWELLEQIAASAA